MAGFRERLTAFLGLAVSAWIGADSRDALPISGSGDAGGIGTTVGGRLAAAQAVLR